MSFLQKYLGDYSSGVANGDLANLANLPTDTGANKPNSTNIVSQAPRIVPPSAAAVQRNDRRQRVLQMMAEDPTRPRAWYVDSESDPHYIVLAFAKMIPELGEIYTCELTIAREKWDPFLFLELVDKEH